MSNFLAQYLVDWATFLPSEEKVKDVIANASRLTTGLVAPNILAPNPSPTKVLFGNNTWGDISTIIPDIVTEDELASIAFSGSASDLSTGTIPLLRLPSEVARRDLGNIFNLSNVFKSNIDLYNDAYDYFLTIHGDSDGPYIQSYLSKPLRINPLGNQIIFPEGYWIQSGSGANRIHFTTSGPTYIQGFGLNPVFIRNGDDQDIVKVSNVGDIFTCLAGYGGSALRTGGTSNTGYVQFTRPNGDRHAYIGFDTGNDFSFTNEQNGTFVFNKGITSTGNIIAKDGTGTRINIVGAGAVTAISEYYSTETHPRWAIGRDLIGGGVSGIGFAVPNFTIASSGSSVGQAEYGKLSFYTTNGTNLVERAYINSSGESIFNSSIEAASASFSGTFIGSGGIIFTGNGEFIVGSSSTAYIKTGSTTRAAINTTADFSVPINAPSIAVSAITNYGNSTISGNVSVGGNLSVTGKASIGTQHFAHSVYHYDQGILIRTNIPASVNSMMELSIEGNGYFTGQPIIARVQAYNYVFTGTLISTGAVSNDPDLVFHVFHYDGYVYFWFAQTGSFQTFTVKLIAPFNQAGITSITNAVKPTSGVTNSVTIIPSKLWTQSNDGASSGLDADLLDGQHGSYYAAASTISGSTNYIPKFTSASTIGNSQIYDDGTNISFGGSSFFNKGMAANGPYTHGSASPPGIISYEYPYVRNFAGDGSGYTWAVSKRSGGVTTDLFTIYDVNGLATFAGNIVTSGNISAGNGASNYRVSAERTGANPAYISIGAFTDSPAIEYSGVNGLRFVHAGTTEVVKIDTSGNVGIGISNPSAKLHVYEALADNYSIYSEGGKNYFGGNVSIGGYSSTARFIVHSPTSGSNTQCTFHLASVRDASDQECHFRMVRTGVAAWNLAQPYVDLTLYLDGNASSPEFTFANYGIFTAKGGLLSPEYAIVGGGGNGASTMKRGTSVYTGYFEWFKPSGVRQGYTGFDAGNTISFINEQGGTFVFNSGASFGGDISISSNGLYSGINQSWIGHSSGNNYLGGVTYFRPAAGGSNTALINGETGSAIFNSTITFRSGFSTYTPDGLFGANALPSKMITPGGKELLFGYLDEGGGQYWPRIGFIGNTNWSAGVTSGGNNFTIGIGNTTPNQFTVSSTGISTTGNVSIGGIIINGGFDFILGNADQTTRGDSGASRALVKNSGSELWLNYNGDFTGGTRIGSSAYISNSGSATFNGNVTSTGDVLASKLIAKGTVYGSGALSAEGYFARLSGHTGINFSTNHLNVGEAAGEIARFTGAGNLILGGSEVSWDSVSKLQVNGTVSSSTEFRLGGNSFSRVAQIDGSGGWGGGYNFNVNSSTAQRDSTGTVSAIRFDGSFVQLFSEPSGSPGAISPRYSFGPTGATFNGNLSASAATIIRASEGALGLSPGGVSNTGYLAFFKPNSTRQGYIGFDAGNDISFTNEVGGIFAFNAGATFNSSLRVASPYHASSFTEMADGRFKSAKHASDTSPHLDLVRAGYQGWIVAQPAVDLHLYEYGESANPNFIFASGGHLGTKGNVTAQGYIFLPNNATGIYGGTSNAAGVAFDSGNIRIRTGGADDTITFSGSGNASFSGALRIGAAANSGLLYFGNGSNCIYQDSNAFYIDTNGGGVQFRTATTAIPYFAVNNTGFTTVQGLRSNAGFGGSATLWQNNGYGSLSLYNSSGESLDLINIGDWRLSSSTTAPINFYINGVKQVEVSSTTTKFSGTNGIFVDGHTSTSTASIGRQYFAPTIYNATQGVLVRTNIPTNTNTMMELSIEGNNFSGSPPTIARLQVYNYTVDNTFYGASALSTDPGLSFDVFYQDGFISFWFLPTSLFQTYTIKLITSLEFNGSISSITESIKPTSGVSNSITITPHKLWTQANDGSGSGLDADLLDGQNSSYYATSSHVHSASDITSGTFTKSQQHAQTAYLDQANVFTQAATFNGSATFGSNLYVAGFYVGSDVYGTSRVQSGLNSDGKITMLPGSTSATGYLAFLKPDNTRQGYIGFDSGNNISFTNEQSGIFAFNAGATFNGQIISTNIGGYSFSTENNSFIRSKDVGGTYRLMVGRSSDDKTYVLGNEVNLCYGDSGSTVGLNISSTGATFNKDAMIIYGTLADVNLSNIQTTAALTLAGNDPGDSGSSKGVSLVFRPIEGRGAVASITAQPNSTNKEGYADLVVHSGNGGFPSTLVELLRVGTSQVGIGRTLVVNNAGTGKVIYGPDSYIEGTATDLVVRQRGSGSLYQDFGTSTIFRRTSDFATMASINDLGELFFPLTQSWIGYGGTSNYLGGATYFRPVAGGAYKAYVDGASGEAMFTGFVYIGASDCRLFRDSGNLYIESDGSINLRDKSSGTPLWSLANDGRTFSKTNVWHSDSDGNPRILHNSGGGTTQFYYNVQAPKLAVGPFGFNASEHLGIFDDTNSFVHQLIRNNNAGSLARSGLVLNAYGNSWGLSIGSAANNSNALEIREDALGANTLRFKMDIGGAATFNGTVNVGNRLQVNSTGINPASLVLITSDYPTAYTRINYDPNLADTQFINNYIGNTTYGAWKFQNLVGSTITTKAEIKGNGDIVANAATFNGNVTSTGSVNARYGISISELATGDLSWILYRNDGGPTQPLYLLDAANSRSHVYFTPGNTDANASTHILSKLYVTEPAFFGKGINLTGPYAHGSFALPGVISYEYPYTRNFTGDGSGYTWAVSKRSGGVTTDLFTIYDASGAVNIKGNDVHLEGSAGGWGSQYAFRGSSGTNRGGFGAVGTSDTLDYYWIGPNFSIPHVKVSSSGLQVNSTGLNPASLVLSTLDYPTAYTRINYDPNLADTQFTINYIGSSVYGGWKFQNLVGSTMTTKAEIKGNGDFVANTATFNGNLTATGTGNHQFGTGTAYSVLANGAIINYIGDGGRFSIAERWWMYKNDGDENLYFRDMVNARMQMTFVPGATASIANTYIHSQLNVEGAASFNRGLTLGADAAGGERIQMSGVNGSYRTIIENNYDSNRAFAITHGSYDVLKSTVDAYTAVTLANTGTLTTVINGGTVLIPGGNLTLPDLGQIRSASGAKLVVGADGSAPMYLLNSSNGALGLKVGSLVVSSSYGYDAPTYGLFVEGAATVSGFLNFGSTDCRMFRDSGSLYIESDATIFMRDTSTGVANWSLVNDGRTFSKVNVWHSDTEGNPRIAYYGSGGATNFYGGYSFVSSDRGHGLLNDGTIIWGSNAVSGNNRGRLSWDTNKAIVYAPLNMDITCGGDLNLSPSGALYGPSPTAGSNNTALATTAFVKSMWNNMGEGHSVNTDFNGITDFGFRYVQGSTNGPGTGSSQFYNIALGLGSDYAYSQYALQLAIPRFNSSDKYLSMRTREGGTWNAWTKIAAGTADIADTAEKANGLREYIWANRPSASSTKGPIMITDTVPANTIWTSDGSVWRSQTRTRKLIAYSSVLELDSSEAMVQVITLGGSLTLEKFTNGFDGASLELVLKQDSMGNRVLVFGTGFRFNDYITSVVLSTTAETVDRILFEYDEYYDVWDIISYVKGSY